MEHSESINEIGTAMSKVQAAMEAAKPTGVNKYDNYTYLTEQDLISAIREPMRENGLGLFMSVDALTTIEGRTTKKGDHQNACHIYMTGLLTHESGQWVKVSSIGEGMDRADKAPYKAMTGAKKYLLRHLFNIPTGDEPEASDVDSTATKPPQRQQAQPRGGVESGTYNGIIKGTKVLKEGEGKKGPWRFSAIEADDGKQFVTFSDAIVDKAAALADAGTPAKIEWHSEDRNNRTSLVIDSLEETDIPF